MSVAPTLISAWISDDSSRAPETNSAYVLNMHCALVTCIRYAFCQSTASVFSSVLMPRCIQHSKSSSVMIELRSEDKPAPGRAVCHSFHHSA